MIVFKNKQFNSFDLNLIEYDFSWEYDVIEDISTKDINLVKKVVKNIQALNIQWASNFVIEFIDIDDLGLYIAGTQSFPHIGLCLPDIKVLSYNYEKQIFLTIVHELYHAEQERNGEEFNCDEAELMANDLYFKSRLGSIL
jgi:hypothetical protein